MAASQVQLVATLLTGDQLRKLNSGLLDFKGNRLLYRSFASYYLEIDSTQ